MICRDATADRQTVRGPACTDCVGDPPDDGPDPDRPETWAFGEAQEAQADEPEHGPAAGTFTCCTTPMPWPARDQDRTCPDCGTIWEREPVDIGAGARIKSAGCAETSDGEHCGDWHDGGRCGACGLYGPGPGCGEVLDDNGTKVNCWLGHDPHDQHEGEFTGAVYRWKHGSRAYQVTGILGGPDEPANVPRGRRRALPPGGAS